MNPGLVSWDHTGSASRQGSYPLRNSAPNRSMLDLLRPRALGRVILLALMVAAPPAPLRRCAGPAARGSARANTKRI